MSEFPYRFLPFRFERFDRSILLANDVGEFCFLDSTVFDRFIHRQLSPSEEMFKNLKSKRFLFDDHLPEIIEQLAIAYRTKKQFLHKLSGE